VLQGEISRAGLDESEEDDSIEPFFKSIDMSVEVEKWGAKAGVKRMDAKK
jgi:hypothetical protein